MNAGAPTRPPVKTPSMPHSPSVVRDKAIAKAADALADLLLVETERIKVEIDRERNRMVHFTKREFRDWIERIEKLTGPPVNRSHRSEGDHDTRQIDPDDGEFVEDWCDVRDNLLSDLKSYLISEEE